VGFFGRVFLGGFSIAQTRTQVMLEAVDGFILVLGVDGHILFSSESLASLLGYLPASLHNTTLYEIVGDADKIPLYNHLNMMSSAAESSAENQVRKGRHFRDQWYLVRFFRIS
jgi:hypothetical protein